MKKLIVLMGAILSCGIANAQLGIGIKAGANYANVAGVDVADAEAVLAYHAGAVVELGLTNRFSLQPELLYSAQGSKFRQDFLGTTLDVENTFNYVLLPVLAKIYIVKGLSIELGPQVGFNVSSNRSIVGLGSTDDYAETVDFSVAAGAGFKLDNGLFFQGRYNWGLTEVESGLDYRNSVVALSVGYFFLKL